jgi:translation elongation factor EF-1beta
MSGKLVQSAKEKSNEISFGVKTNGVYVLVYETKTGSETFRFKL